ncbi:MAG TPA: cyclopropane-fatty-acyl-phospholipid synthase family protein, partial [Bacteroidota bacterium]|nr:cyclopropane-fatty-acyl-phospholipid synthase family protein [Bacteroidota bacterium]
LESAQEQKLEYLCRKLDLHSGDRLLDLGCGWGGLICFAAKTYGVRAHGITLSQAQAEYAQARIEREGLADRVSVEVKDYRELDESSAYDKIVSVGMVEHVGITMLAEYFERAHRLLTPGGRFLNHGISSGFNAVRLNGASFSDEYIFPDSEILPLSTTIHAAETRGFEVRDVESLREHYMLTLRHWLHRLEAAHTEAVRLTDESTYRIWRLNHAGAAAGFASGRNSIFQTLLVKPANGRSTMPLTRERWYR